MRIRALSRWTGTGALVAVLTVGASPAEAQQSGTQGTDAQPHDAQANQELPDAQVVLRVDGMSCPFCAYGLEKRLLKIEAIEALVIRVSDGEVRIRVADGATVSDEELDDAVKRAGFSLREITRTDS